MKNLNNFLLPIAFFILLAFSLYHRQWLESVLYFLVTGGFAIINLIKAKYISTRLKFWNSLAWGLVLGAALMFIIVLLNDANQEILK